MIEIEDTRRENLPLNEEQFKNIIEQVANNVDKDKIKPFEIKEDNFIFDVKDTDNFTDGFELITQMQINENDELGIAIIKMIIFENDDEWLEAFQRIKNQKKINDIVIDD